MPWSQYDEFGRPKTGSAAAAAENMAWYSGQDSPTPSGGNFGDTVTGQQDIYNMDTSPPETFSWNTPPTQSPTAGTYDPNANSVWMAPPGDYGNGSNQTSIGGSGETPWWYAGADTYASEVAKMGKGDSGGSSGGRGGGGGTPTGSSGGVYGGMTLQQAREQTMGIQQSNWEEQQKILDKQWNDRFAIEQAASDKTWAERLKAQTETSSAEWNKQQATLQAQWESRLKAESETSNKTWSERFAAENAKWAEQAKTSQQLSQETWDKQYATMQADWDAKFGKTNEAERAKWAEQFAAANTEWERRYNLEKNKITTTRVVGPTGPMPTAGEMPTFAAPARNEGRIKELTQQKSAAGLRAMRAQIQKAMGQGYRNPNVKRMTLRDALAGYGQGIENVMTGAQTAATGEYNTEYASDYDTAGKNWQTAYQTKMQDWQNKVNDYFKNYGTVTTTSGGL